MNFRTDLALERRESLQGSIKGVVCESEQTDDIKITRIKVTCPEGEKAIDKPMGNYITVELPSFSYHADISPEFTDVLTKEISALLGKEDGSVLVCGIGNSDITPDALGPEAVSRIFATRHIGKELAKSIGFEHLRPVCAVAPGVLGRTGIEVGEMLLGIIEKTKPSAVIAIDALASRNLSRLGCTVQLSDTGIIPGGGVGNARVEISKRTLKVPVISIGVPTVVDGKTLVCDLTDGQRDKIPKQAEQMVVTPREIDLLIDRASRLIAHSVNCALQPNISKEDLLTIMA